jgi:hypothetical protein
MKRSLLLTSIILAGIFATIVLAQNRNKETKTTEPKTQWEYLVVVGGTKINLPSSGTSPSLSKLGLDSSFREHYVLEKNLDKLGSAGWELVEVTLLPNTNEPIFHLKRAKETD